MKPTAEQQAALDLFATGESLAIEAGAGTGKTATLLMLAQSTTRRGQYIAFNRAIVEESRGKFPSNVNCSTAHSLAYRAIAAGTPFEDRMRSGKRMRSIDIANRLGINPLRITTDDGEAKLLSQSFLAGLAINAVLRFCQTADDKPSRRHVPRVPGLDPADGSSYELNKAVARHIEGAVKRAWSDLTTPEGGLPFTTNVAMAVFLKLWQLSGPRIGADFILFDEAQDANPVMVAVVAAQTHAQLVWVGDSQQQIYAFTGAINALASVPADNRTFLTQSFRFGQPIADVANFVLSLIDGAELRLRGFDEITSVVAPVAEPNVILTRTNATAVQHVLDGLRDERKVHLVGGGREIVKFCKAAQALMRGERTDHPELACFESWSEVQSYAQEDEQGGDLKLLVKLIDEFTAEAIIAALDDQVREDEADLIVSTAHKSKGRQWGSVQLAGDFQEDRIASSDDEKRLLYVAVTRAQHELDVDAIPFLRDGFKPTAAPAPAVTVAKPKPAAKAKVEERISKHIGEVGGRIDLPLTVVNAHGMTTRYGFTYLTKLEDADGNQVKCFLDDELDAGSTYQVSAKVKEHGEFRGVKETTINYARISEEVTA